MSTLIKSGTLWFSDYHLRWLTAAEALTCQGFPVHQKWSYNNPCCSFAMRNAGLCRVASPSRSAMIGQAGNSMHTEVSAAILSFALLEVQIDKFARQMFSTCIHIAPSLTAPGPSAPCQEERAVDGPVKQFRSSGQAWEVDFDLPHNTPFWCLLVFATLSTVGYSNRHITSHHSHPKICYVFFWLSTSVLLITYFGCDELMNTRAWSALNSHSITGYFKQTCYVQVFRTSFKSQAVSLMKSTQYIAAKKRHNYGDHSEFTSHHGDVNSNMWLLELLTVKTLVQCFCSCRCTQSAKGRCAGALCV